MKVLDHPHRLRPGDLLLSPKKEQLVFILDQGYILSSHRGTMRLRCYGNDSTWSPTSSESSIKGWFLIARVQG